MHFSYPFLLRWQQKFETILVAVIWSNHKCEQQVLSCLVCIKYLQNHLDYLHWRSMVQNL